MGFTNVAPADGAFYIYVDVSKQVEDSVKMAWDLLETAGVAITPGNDFEDPASDLGRKRIRFSYCGSTQDMREGMERMKKWWEIYAGRIASA
jgi:aspartate/methionine/tyrosine aminotransferase